MFCHCCILATWKSAKFLLSLSFFSLFLEYMSHWQFYYIREIIRFILLYIKECPPDWAHVIAENKSTAGYYHQLLVMKWKGKMRPSWHLLQIAIFLRSRTSKTIIQTMIVCSLSFIFEQEFRFEMMNWWQNRKRQYWEDGLLWNSFRPNDKRQHRAR